MPCSSQPDSKSLKMFAHRVEGCHDAASEYKEKIKAMCELLDADQKCQLPEYPRERTIVLCESDNSARNATVALHTKKYHTCILTADMFSECYAVADMERKKFITGHGRVAVCSVDVFEMADLPHIEHYIFFEIPTTKLAVYGNIINVIQRKATEQNRVACIDTITSNMEKDDSLKAVIMEMDSRDISLPLWLEDLFNQYSPNVSAPVTRDTSFEMSVAVSTVNTTTPVVAALAQNSVTAPKKQSPEPFDPRKPRQDEQGRYIVPSNYVTGWDDDDEEMNDEDSNEFEYDYDNFDDEMDVDYNYN